MNKMKTGILLLIMGMAVAGCSTFDTVTGRAKNAPDEFEVVIRPPLTLPPSFSLKPVGADGVIRSAPSDAVSLTDSVLTSNARAEAYGFDGIFGTAAIVPDIRDKIDGETLGVQIDRRLPLNTLFGGERDVGPALSSEAEQRRIRDAIERGDSLTTTPTPAVDPVFNEPLSVQ